MVDGRLRKFYEETVLLEQVFVMDGETRVGKVIENAAQEVGAPIEFSGFARLELGEGVPSRLSGEKAAAGQGVEIIRLGLEHLTIDRHGFIDPRRPMMVEGGRQCPTDIKRRWFSGLAMIFAIHPAIPLVVRPHLGLIPPCDDRHPFHRRGV